MDELVEEELGPATSVGDKLRAAREAKGLSIEEIASQTRIPTRHLENLELGAWDKLPAPTYTMGFAKSYANAVGLDRAQIADDLRLEMGGVRAATTFQPETFEPADPKRVMPKGLVLGALAALLLVALLLSWLAGRDTAGDEATTALNESVATAPPAPPPAAANQVTITADQLAWVDIKDGTVILKQGELAQGESFVVPPGALAPTLSTAKPEALRIMVGAAAAPVIGQPGTKVDNVSLLPADLLKGPVVPATAAPTTTAPTPTSTRPAPRRAAPSPAPSTAARATPVPVAAPAPPATSNSAG